MRKLTTFLILIMSLGFAVRAADGKKTQLLDTSTYLEMESIQNPQISPDGEYILFVRRSIDKMNDRTRSNLWITDIYGEKVRELTSGNWADSSPVWSPDGKRIAFLSDRDGTVQIYVMWLDTGEVAQLTHVEHKPVGLQWSPDGKTLAFGMFLPETKSQLPVKLPEFPEGANLAKPAKVIDRIIWAYDGIGYLPKGYMHIFTLGTEVGGTPKQVTSGDYTYNDPRRFWNCDPQWSGDGEKIFFAALLKPWEEVEMEINECDIHSLDLKSGDIQKLTDRDGPDRGIKFHPMGNGLPIPDLMIRIMPTAIFPVYTLWIAREAKNACWLGIFPVLLPISPGLLTEAVCTI